MGYSVAMVRKYRLEPINRLCLWCSRRVEFTGKFESEHQYSVVYAYPVDRANRFNAINQFGLVYSESVDRKYWFESVDKQFMDL